ncbi:ATP-binding cassette domain-containing protein [Heliobacillus mobilis]|uniref:ATP-binding cassette domain-containing protein n=1 Tax=Heliobacterium mobile TaxID=28064 RepID=A0A6I3SB87_HELMO|nr:ABC transporter ATP-binding protein [Heliobacterium mobile]MTV47578.1 ATP-binding cassette domain-containing protein [Heliobacterium mobile]
MIELTDVSLRYGKTAESVQVLERLSLTVPPGERCVLIGPSGCGKSTLLQVLAGLIPPQAGKINVGGQAITGPRRQTSYILQDFGLFPWKTVEENVALALRIQGTGRSDAFRAIQPILSRLGLAGMEKRYPRQLSGGQRQRVAVGRALATKPDLLLMDEPFSALDALTRESLQDLILEIAQREGLTVLLVTHSIEEAALLGQRILIFDGPPLQLLDNIENPRSGRPDYRRDRAFHETCNRIRVVLDKLVKAGDPQQKRQNFCNGINIDENARKALLSAEEVSSDEP